MCEGNWVVMIKGCDWAVEMGEGVVRCRKAVLQIVEASCYSVEVVIMCSL